MAATTTPSINWLVEALALQLPEVSFEAGQDFAWSPHSQTVIYDESAIDAVWQLLHEAGHATCGHSGYRRDIELLGFEVEAWTTARALADRLSIDIPEDAQEQHLDTYRDWLHARSQCVSCAQTGIQVSVDKYRCLHCPTSWRVNDSRRCGLRRYRAD